MAKTRHKKKIQYLTPKRKRLIIASCVLAALILALGIWWFVDNYDSSPVKEAHYDDTIVATLTYTDAKGQVYTHGVTYAEVRYYVKERKLTVNQALDAVAADWVPEVLSQMYKIGLTVEDIKDMEAELEEYQNFTGLHNYEYVLAGQYMTVPLHERFMELKYLTLRIKSDLTETKETPLLTHVDKALVMEYLEKNFYAAKHIYIPKDSDPVLIQEAYQKLASGSSFDQVLAEYNQDTAMTDEGILFVEDAMTEDYFQQVAALEEGQMSGALELSNGYFIIQRIDATTLLLENYDEASLLYAEDLYHHLYADIQCDLKISKEPVCHKIDSSIR